MKRHFKYKKAAFETAMPKSTKTEQEKQAETAFKNTMVNLKTKLQQLFDDKGEVAMARDSDYARQIFKVDKTTGESLSMSESEFIKLLQSSTANPEVQVNETHFQLKKAYPIHNRESLMQYLLEHGRRGIKDDERLRYCYRGIENDIINLISEGWVRVIKT